MAEVLAFSYTTIGDWVPNLLISLWARVVLVLVWVGLVGALQYLVFRQVFIGGRFLWVVENFIIAKSFRANEDELLPSTRWCNLPEHLLIDEILPRLLVKSLIRFKSVCKRWHSLPTNPIFIASHLKHSNTSNMLSRWNPTNLKDSISNTNFNMMSCWNRNQGIIGSPYFAFQPVNINFRFDRKPDLVLGPCDGLFCLYWRPSMFNTPYQVIRFVKQVPIIALRNPGTRAFSILPMSKLDLPPYKAVYCCHVGFGFDLQTKSIKVVKVGNLHSDEASNYQYINRAEVYDLVSGSWRVLDLDNTLQQVFVLDEPNHGMYNNNDGVFHWHSYGKSRGNIRHHSLVLSFDMSSRELFKVTRMPKKYNAFGTFFHFSLLRDSLAVNFSLVKAGHESIAIWVMKKDFYPGVVAGESFSSYSWYDELTVDLPYSHPCLSTGFWRNNVLLLWKTDWELKGVDTSLV